MEIIPCGLQRATASGNSRNNKVMVQFTTRWTGLPNPSPTNILLEALSSGMMFRRPQVFLPQALTKPCMTSKRQCVYPIGYNLRRDYGSYGFN